MQKADAEGIKFLHSAELLLLYISVSRQKAFLHILSQMGGECSIFLPKTIKRGYVSKKQADIFYEIPSCRKTTE